MVRGISAEYGRSCQGPQHIYWNIALFCGFVVHRTQADKVIIVKPFAVIDCKRCDMMHLDIMRIYAVFETYTA